MMKTIAHKFRGVSAFMVTPTKDDGNSIDPKGLKRFIDLQIESKVDSVTVFGSTGGIGSFTETERQEVISTVVRHAKGRVPVIAGTGAIQTTGVSPN